jgi:uncharacterized membrane protein
MFFLVAWGVFTALLVFHRWNIWFERSYGDSAFLAETVENIYNYGRATTLAGQSAVEIVYNGFITATASDLENLNTDAVDGNWSILSSHAYLILFLLAPLHVLLPVPLLLSFALGLSFSGAVLVTYFVLRSKNVSAAWASLFCAVIASHPFWRIPLLLGQDYVDRYYVGLCSLMMLTLLGINDGCRRSRWIGLLLLFILCCLVSERMALIAGGILVYASGVAFLDRSRRSAARLALLGGVGVVYAAVLMRVFLKVHSYETFLSLQSFISPLFLSDEAVRGKTILFLLFNAPLILLSMRCPKWGFLALGIMVPNLLGNIGGAEKIGWSTHYHSLYIPTLVVVSALGFSRIGPVAKGVMLAVMTAIYVYVDPYSFAKIRTTTEPLANTVPVVWPWKFVNYNTDGTYVALHNRQKVYEDAVPVGSVVSTPEFGMGRLIFGRKVFMFPLGIRQADVVLMSTSPTRQSVYVGAASFLSGAEKDKVDDAVMKRVVDAGFDLSNPQEIEPGVYAFRKVSPQR